MGPVRLTFKVDRSSGSDEGYEEDELEKPGPACKGWRSVQYCIFPQELIIRLHKRATIDRIQIMAHQTMIPSKVEFQLGDSPNLDDAPDLRKALFFPMGEVDLSNNKENGYKGRQMQTIEISTAGASFPAKGLFLKLLLKKNHLVKRNEYNQVALMGLNVIGYPDGGASDREEQRALVWPAHTDMAFHMYTDEAVAEAVERLEWRRYAAQSDGRLNDVQRLKAAIIELTDAGTALGVLVAEKRIAVEHEDFRKAKDKDAEIERERDKILRENNVTELLGLGGGMSAASPRSPLPPPSRHKMSAANRQLDPSNNYHNNREKEEQQQHHHYKVESTKSPSPPPPPVKSQPESNLKPSPVRKLSTNSYDERAIRPSRDASPVPPDHQYEESGDEQINGIDQREMMIAVEVFGKPTVKSALHKNAVRKTEAGEQILARLKSLAQNEWSEMKPGKAMRGTQQVLSKILRNKVWSVFNKAIEIHSYLFGAFLVTAPKTSRKEIESAALKTYKELLLLSGDTSTDRVSQKAKDNIKLMLAVKQVRNSGVLQERLVQPFKPEVAMKKGGEHREPPKQALVRGVIVLDDIVKAGLVGRGGPPLVRIEDLTAFGISAVEHSILDVRKVGERIMLALYKIDGDRVRDFLPEDDIAVRKTNIVYRKLFEEFDRLDRVRAH